MNSSPSGGEDLHVVQPEKPLPVDSALPRKGRFTFLASLLLIAIAFSLGLSYFLEKRWVDRAAGTHPNGGVETTLVEPGTEAKAGAPVALGPDAFHVSAISLDGQRVAIVNGQKLSEGDTLMVVASSGPIPARVEKIENGMVRFAAGGKMVDAKLDSTLAPPP